MKIDLYILDTGPLGLITNPRESDDARGCKAWIRFALLAGARVMVPEIADYEIRRELIRAGKTKGLARLDILIHEQGTIPVDSRVWIRAAELWAEVRKEGKQTASDFALDADVVIAATAQVAAEEGLSVVVISDNTRHLSRFVDARDWRIFV